MEKLLTELNEKYINYIGENKKIKDRVLQSNFIRLLKEESLNDRKKQWDDFKVNINSLKELPELANPFFIGFGNPNAKILFIGKEKAFNITTSPDLLLQENVNNILHWELIAQGKDSTTFEFNPENPRSYHKDKIKSRHTWGKYAKILAKLNDELILEELLKDASNSTQNIFDHCFLTEINHLPSQYSTGKKMISERKNFFKNDFYKGFDTVVIGAQSYLSQDDIQDIFDAELVEKDYILGEKGKIRITSITCDIYKSNSQFIVYCQQLSGASTWTNEALRNLCALIRT